MAKNIWNKNFSRGLRKHCIYMQKCKLHIWIKLQR